MIRYFIECGLKTKNLYFRAPHGTGRSGVHTHMTNTRITDPEILEKRYVDGSLVLF